jgi:hypothetical protein
MGATREASAQRIRNLESCRRKAARRFSSYSGRSRSSRSPGPCPQARTERTSSIRSIAFPRAFSTGILMRGKGYSHPELRSSTTWWRRFCSTRRAAPRDGPVRPRTALTREGQSLQSELSATAAYEVVRAHYESARNGVTQRGTVDEVFVIKSHEGAAAHVGRRSRHARSDPRACRRNTRRYSAESEGTRGHAGSVRTAAVDRR